MTPKFIDQKPRIFSVENAVEAQILLQLFLRFFCSGRPSERRGRSYRQLSKQVKPCKSYVNSTIAKDGKDATK